MWAFPVLAVAFLIAIPLFVWNATAAILNSTDGDFGEIVIDPSQPGYFTYVSATPSHLTLGVDEAGNLVMVAIIGLGPNDEGGSILLLNPKTILGDGETIASMFASGGVDEVDRSLRDFLTIGFTSVNTMSASNWDVYVDLVSPLSVDLDVSSYETAVDEVSLSPESECCLYEGTTQLNSDEVGRFLSNSEDDESGQLRHIRQELFWKIWIEAISTGNDAALLPGEVDSGFGRMVWGLSRGEVVVVQISQSMKPEGTYVDSEIVIDAVLDMVPFPLPNNPGARTTVRLLDGVGGLDLAGDYSAGLVRAGAQIVILGNASEFGKGTELIYHDDENAELVEEYQEILGGGEIFFEPLTDAAVEVTIIVGDDLIGGK